jgi:hypothetical protein
MKQTAVEWLQREVNTFLTNDQKKILKNVWEQAIEMEKDRATEYGEYCMKCDRIGVLPRSFEDWRKSITFKQEQ